MRVRVGRVACAAACLVWLAGCETTSTPDNPFSKLTVPMMICIFPVLFVVILLPVFVRLYLGHY